TKILLNVHYSDLRYFEWHRALLALANRCCLITEPCKGFEPFIPGKHFVMTEADNLTTCCDYYLEHEDEREAIAAEAYNFLRERFTQKDNCRVFLQQIENAFQAKNGQEQVAFNVEANAEAPL
ncbi:MAG: glycosyltransferase, partial [Candidatus Udaeobacter sp.]